MGEATDCLFCGIVAGDVEAGMVLEDDDFVAFLDARPVFKGHVLLVPRQHVVTLTDLPDGLRGFFWPRTRYADAADRDRFAAMLRAVL